MKKEALKALALKAKNRMIHKKDEAFIEVELNNDIDIKVIEKQDKLFYDKVRSLLESDADIVNPIKYLMDERLLMKLDARGREKYLLETVDKYHTFRKMFEQEKELNLC